MKKSIRILIELCCCVMMLVSCKKEYSYEGGLYLQATGSLSDVTGNCIYNQVAGTYYNGVKPGADTDYVDVEVNVTAIGAYTISTDLQNGFKFAGSGQFASTGINTIRLTPVGTPILPKSTSFKLSFDTAFCNFTVDVHDSTGLSAGNAPIFGWQFSTPDNTFSGSLVSSYYGDSALWQFGGKMIYITGYTSNAKDTALDIWLYLPIGAIAPGPYTTVVVAPAKNEAFFIFNKNATPIGGGDPIYESSAAMDSYTVTNITVNIISFDASKNVLKGSFSGTAEIINNGYQTGKIVEISNGMFTAPFGP